MIIYVPSVIIARVNSCKMLKEFGPINIIESFL